MNAVSLKGERSEHGSLKGVRVGGLEVWRVRNRRSEQTFGTDVWSQKVGSRRQSQKVGRWRQERVELIRVL